ncbi:MAG: hypothetical protein ACK5N0_02750 [Synechococcaceae cyanobacterium]
MAHTVRPELWGVCLLLLWPGAPAGARALPFDPLPSAFQHWLNQRQGWPAGPRPRFSEIGHCSDLTAAASPYGQPMFTCQAGRISFGPSPGSQQQHAATHCRLTRVSYYPNTGAVRYWKADCR